MDVATVRWPNSLWAAVTPPGPDLPELIGTQEADVVAGGKPLRLEDVEVVAGSGAVPFNRKRFGGTATTTPSGTGAKSRALRRKRK
jgi:hypothetical protein